MMMIIEDSILVVLQFLTLHDMGNQEPGIMDYVHLRGVEIIHQIQHTFRVKFARAFPYFIFLPFLISFVLVMRSYRYLGKLTPEFFSTTGQDALAEYLLVQY